MVTMALTMVTIHGRIQDAVGTPAVGTVRFELPVALRDALDHTLIGDRVAITATLDGQGEFVAAVPATDSPGMSPQDWAYNITVATSAALVQFAATVPGTGTVEFDALVPLTAPSSGEAYAPVNHTHSAAAITSGTLDAARLPVGTEAGTVCAGDDARLSNARTPTTHASTHASGGGDALTPGDIGAVPTTRSVSAGTGLTGGGDLTVDRSLAVAYGTTSVTACAGDDARLSDARTPTAHTHAGADITSGTLDAARIPDLSATYLPVATHIPAPRIRVGTSASVTPAATAFVEGTPATIAPSAGHTGLVSVVTVAATFGGTFDPGETAVLNVRLQYSDSSTSAAIQIPATGTGTAGIGPEIIAGYLTDDVYITGVQCTAHSTVSNSAVSVTGTITGTQF